jgi:hypothetical protein
VASAIRGKRGQALLKELEAALLALPQKRLVAGEFANAQQGEVCALGAVALKRRMDKGQDRAAALLEIQNLFPEGCEAEAIAQELNIAEALCKEITYENDDDYRTGDSPEFRYQYMLKWVRRQIAKQEASA